MICHDWVARLQIVLAKAVIIDEDLTHLNPGHSALGSTLPGTVYWSGC